MCRKMCVQQVSVCTCSRLSDAAQQWSCHCFPSWTTRMLPSREPTHVNTEMRTDPTDPLSRTHSMFSSGVGVPCVGQSRQLRSLSSRSSTALPAWSFQVACAVKLSTSSSEPTPSAEAGPTTEHARHHHHHAKRAPRNPGMCLRDQHFSFTGHFVANPATTFTKKRKGQSDEMQ